MLGAGAIGSLFAAFLRGAGCPVTLVLREGSSPAVSELIVERQQERECLTLPVSTCTDSAQISHLLVTTKAYDVSAAVRAVTHRLDAASQVVLLANGMGFAHEIHRERPWLKLYQGTTTEGAYTLSRRHIRHAGSGQTRIGQPGTKSPPAWFDCWSACSANCLWDENIEQALWLKLAINCAINPLSALHRCRNGELLERPEIAAQVARLCKEIAQISAAAGYDMPGPAIEARVREVITGTADNHSSMLQDVQQGRPTEIDYITGYLLQVAAQYQVAAPLNNDLLEQVKNLA